MVKVTGNEPFWGEFSGKTIISEIPVFPLQNGKFNNLGWTSDTPNEKYTIIAIYALASLSRKPCKLTSLKSSCSFHQCFFWNSVAKSHFSLKCLLIWKTWFGKISVLLTIFFSFWFAAEKRRRIILEHWQVENWLHFESINYLRPKWIPNL